MTPTEIPQEILSTVGDAAATLTQTQLGAVLVLSLVANVILGALLFRSQRRTIEHLRRLAELGN